MKRSDFSGAGAGAGSVLVVDDEADIRELLELSIEDISPLQPPPMLAMARSMDAGPGAPISEGTKTVEVRISTRWRFVGK